MTNTDDNAGRGETHLQNKPGDSPYKPTTVPEAATSEEEARAFLRVASGLRLVFWGVILSILFILLGLPLVLMLAPVLGPLAVFVPPTGALLGTAIGLVGRILCLSVPPGTGSRAFIYTAVVCDLVVIAKSAVEFFVELPSLVQLATVLLPTVAIVAFVLFLRQLAKYFGEEKLATNARDILILGAIVIVLAGGMIAAVLLLSQSSATAGNSTAQAVIMPLSCMGGIMVVALVILYLLVLSRSRLMIMRRY